MANEHIGLYGLPSFYPTPRALALKLIALANIQPREVILEPSAGSGNIARLIRQLYPNNPLWVIEKEPLLRLKLLLDGFRVVGSDFLTYAGQVDVVIQNPPFSNNYQDIDHFRKAWSVGRRVVSLLHAYSAFPHWDTPTSKPVIFRDWIDASGLHRTLAPAGAFLDSEFPSAVQTCIVWGEHPCSTTSVIPSSRVKTAATSSAIPSTRWSSPLPMATFSA